jgi:hypothetical protein
MSIPILILHFWVKPPAHFSLTPSMLHLVNIEVLKVGKQFLVISLSQPKLIVFIKKAQFIHING